MKNSLCTLVLMALLCGVYGSTAWADAPARVPVQGVLSGVDGVAVEGSLSVRFALYDRAEGGEALWEEAQTVEFASGFFSVSLGVAEALPLEVFRDAGDVWLGVKVGDDVEMTRLRLDTTPFAAFSQYAGTAQDAETLNGFEPSDFANAEHDTPWGSIVDVPERLRDFDPSQFAQREHDTPWDSIVGVPGALQGFDPSQFALREHDTSWGSIVDIPVDLADGDDDTTYRAGEGLELADGAFGLRGDCAAGDVLKRRAVGWECAPDVSGEDGLGATDELIASFALDGTVLAVSDAGGTFSVDLASLQDGVDDADADASNELIEGVEFDGSVLSIVEGEETFMVDLSGLRDGVDDADADPENELLLEVSLDGTSLVLTDAGGTFAVDLSSLQDGVDDADADASNELNASVVLNGTTLEIADAGGTLSVDLSTLQDGVDDADADASNELNASVALNGTALEITDAGGTLSADLSSLQDGVEDDDADPTNELVTGFALNASVLELSDAGGTRSVDLGSLRNPGAAAPSSGVQVVSQSATFATPGIVMGQSGFPVMCLRDGSHSIVMCEDAMCSSKTTTSIGGDGRCSVAMNASGVPMAVSTNNGVVLSICDDGACSSVSQQVIDADGSSPVVVLGADSVPVIAYRNSTDETVYVAHCSDEVCSSWSTQAIETGSNLAVRRVDMVLGMDGNPVVVYTDHTNNATRVVRCGDASCSTFSLNSVGSVGSNTAGGRQASVTLGTDGMPVVSMYDSDSDELIITHCESADCSSSTSTVADTDGNSGAFNDVTIGWDGHPIVVYRNITNSSVRIGRCADTTCTSGFVYFEFEDADNVGSYTAVTTGMDGFVYAVYYNASDSDFMLRRLPLGRGVR